MLSLRTSAVEAGHDGAHAADANVCRLRTMPADACTMRSAHAAPLTTLCSPLPAATWPWLAVASPSALLQTFFALAGAGQGGCVPPDAGKEHVLPNVGTRAPAHHRSSSANVRWAERQSRPHDGLRMQRRDTSRVSGGLMSNTSQPFFDLTMLQFSLRDGNVYYDVMYGT